MKYQTREIVIEECAAACDDMAYRFRKAVENLPHYRGIFLKERADQCEECAKEIRMLKAES